MATNVPWYPGIGSDPTSSQYTPYIPQVNAVNTTAAPFLPYSPPPPVSNQKMSIYSNAAGNPVSQADYEKAMTERYASTRVGTGANDYGYTGTGTQSRAGINAPQPNTGGGISFSFGGGGGGGGGSSVPSNVLTPRQFPPYESTYVPPTPATPDPYNWATRDPYIYGEGLSNAGAAYDIWGSKPGTNPYLLSTPSSYTPGLLGMQPVQLPTNVPSTNVGANINNNINNNGGDQRQKFTGTPEQIIRDYGYYDRTAPNQTNVPPSMRDSAPNAKIMLEAAAVNVKNGIYPNMKAAMDAQVAFSKKYPALTPAENAAQIAASQKLMNERFKKPVVDTTPKKTEPFRIPVAGTGASGPPGRGSTTPIKTTGVSTYTAKKTAAAKSVANYNKTATYKINLHPKTGKPRL